MQLVEIYALHLKSTQAALARLAQVLGTTVGDPSTTRAREAALGSYDQIIRVGVERFGDQALRDLRTVGVGGVNKVHPQLDSPPEHAAGLLRIVGFTHDTLPRQAHGAEAQAIDEEVVAQRKRAGGCRVRSSILVGHASPFRFGSDRFYRRAFPPMGAKQPT